jgi:preprotein translocase subunit SecG
MAWLNTLLLVVLVISSIALIVLVLLQHGKGADMGAAFGGGASGSLFGASGSANFLSRSTAAAATLFFASTLGLALLATHGRVPKSEPAGIMGTMQQPAAPAKDAVPIPSAPAPAMAPPAAPPAPESKAGEIPAK